MKKDVVIIGGGPSGLALACLLSKLKLQIAIIEKANIKTLEDPYYDGRETALTHPSKDLLSKIGAWRNIDEKYISPIKSAKVLNGYSTYSLDFNAKNDNRELGYFVSNHKIKQSIYQEVAKLKNVEVLTEIAVEDIKTDSHKGEVSLSNGQKIEAKLICGADGRFSKSRNKMGISADMHDFARNMIVTKVEHEKDHESVALECFYHDRVLAVLPLKENTSSIVITADKDDAENLVEMPEKDFCKQVENYFSENLGKIKLISKRFSYPLVSVYADKFYKTRFALIGDASVGMHPVTAHGYNLGLNGQNILYKEIKKAVEKGEDIGSSHILRNYHKKHVLETKLMYHGTNTVVSVFTNNKMPVKFLRELMLRAANSKYLPFKSIIENRLSGKKFDKGIFSIFKNYKN